LEFHECPVYIFLEEQSPSSPVAQHDPEYDSVNGYGIDYTGLLSVPGDKQDDVVALFEFGPVGRGLSCWIDVGLRSCVLMPATLLRPRAFQGWFHDLLAFRAKW